MNAPDLSSLMPEISDLGLLIGLLTGTAENPSLNTGWFSNPLEGFDNGFNWPNLQPLLTAILPISDTVSGPDAGILDESWYSIKINDKDGNPTDSGFYFVEKTVGDDAYLGVGTQYIYTTTIGGETINIQPFAFLPVFIMPNTAGASPLFALDTSGPVELGVEVTLSGTFSQSGTAYNGMIFMASFDFSATAPALTFKLREPNGQFEDASTANVDAVINTILGLTPVVAFLDGNVLPQSSPVNFTWGQLFNAAGWLATDASPYSVGTITIPTSAGALEDYVVTTLFNILNKFLGNNQVITLFSEKATDTTPGWSVNLVLDNGRYGVNIQVTGLSISSSPQINIQVGALTADGTDWISKAGGTTPEGMGLSFYLISGTAPNFTFDPGFELINVGFDILNNNGTPLFNINGFAINEAQVRGYFSTLQNDAWGVAVAIDGISLPLIPPSSAGSSSVPGTLLSAGDSGGGSGDPKPPVNPEFSLLAAYVSSFYFQLFDANDQPENIVVLPIQKSFGPVELKDIGIGWDSGTTQLLFQLDGSLNLNALNIELDNLTIGIPVTTPADLSSYTLDLDGLGISFASGPVTIAGGFLKDATSNPVEYNGAVSIQVAAWGITALGSFASLDGNPSLFIFGVLNAELGGPPFFFVTGAAVGFGYNRTIIMPSIDNVTNFPFVQAANNPALFSGKGTDDILAAMSTSIPPELGEYWLAAGIKFTSFELLNSFALLMIQFGQNFEVDLLGTSTLQMPKASEGTAYVNAEMELEVIFDPSQGVISALAQLTSNSYVIDSSCVLSGGFAFYSWFGPSPYAGDFVVTLGGYNAAFVPPSYYPAVPRLGFNWNVSDQITFSGDAYFALTPSCVMAGGALSLVYSDGDLNAWFDAHADFLISWKPFHYDISIGLSIGVSYRLNLLFVHTTISVSLGIDVEIYGPDFGGTAYVDFYIISFTVSFGANPNPPAPVDWTDFQQYFLPQTSGSQSAAFLQFDAQRALGADDDTSVPLVVKLNTSAGLVANFTSGTDNIWIVDPFAFAFNTDSAIPATTITFANGPGGPGDAPPPITCNAFGVKPVGSMTLQGDDSTQLLTLTKLGEGNSGYQPYSVKNWVFSTAPKNVPQALWGTVNTGSETPSSTSVPDITSGLTSAAPGQNTLTGPPPFAISIFDFTPLDPTLQPLLQTTAALVTLNSAGSITQIENTLYNFTTNANTCTGLFNGLQDVGSLATQNGSMILMAQTADDIFQGSPMLAPSDAVSLSEAKRAFKTYPRGNFMPHEKVAESEPSKINHSLITEIFNYQFGTDTASSSVLADTRSVNLLRKNLTPIMDTGLAGRGAYRMQPGQVHIWQLNTIDANDVFGYDGTLPLRVLFFDKNIELINDELIPKGNAGSIHLPSNAVHLIIRAMDNSANPKLLGWHAGAQLPLLSPKYLMGKGCLIRPQSPHRTGRNQFTYGTGVSQGSKIVAKNSWRKNGSTAYGWTETLFPSSVKEVFVTARLKAGEVIIPEGALNVRIIYRDAGGKKQAITINKQSEGVIAHEFWHRFIVPDDVPGSFSVWVKAADDITVWSVSGSAKNIDSLTEDLYHELSRHESALGYNNINDSTLLTLDNILNEH